MTGGIGSNDGLITLRGRIEGGKLVSLLDHMGNDLGEPVVSSKDGSGRITKIADLTQAQYDAIPVKDPATLYVIVG